MHARRWAAGLGMAVLLAACTVRVSVDMQGGDPNSSSSGASISADGRYVAFTSLASDLVEGDGNTAQDVYRRDLREQTTDRVSVDTAGGDPNTDSFSAAISGDGGRVAFGSVASDLVADDANAKQDVFVRDLAAGTTTRVSVDTAGGDPNDHSFDADISADGNVVTLTSLASDFVADDGNGAFDVFARDLAAGTTTRVSVDTTGGDPNGSSGDAAVSADGRYVAFTSFASDLVEDDDNGHGDVFVRDLVEGTTVRVSVDTAGGDPNQVSESPDITDDGRQIAFASTASDLVPDDGNICVSEFGPLSCRDVFVRDLDTETTTRVSVDADGGDAGKSSHDPSISGDGRFVAFASEASDIVTNDGNDTDDVFVRDLVAGTTLRASVSKAGANADSMSRDPSINGDGRLVAFESFASNLVLANDLNNTVDIFTRVLR